MRRLTGWAMLAGLVVAASAANAQMLAPYRGVSDFDGPYGRPYAAAPPPAYGYDADGPDYGYGPGPALLPLPEVYAVLRDNGFSPLGVPHQRGFVYTIAAMDRNGEDGRLVIDGRNGRILRFVPAYGQGPYGGNFGPERMSGPAEDTALPPPVVIRGVPRPPAPVPHVASRAVMPLPAPKPAIAARPAETPSQQSTTTESKPAVPAPSLPGAPRAAAQASAAAPAGATVGEARPAAPMIRPTQPMPQVQGLE